MVALNFTEEDLAAKREGYLTKKQRSELNGVRQSWKIFFALAIAAIPFGTGWAIVDGIRIHDSVASRLGIVGLIWTVSLGIAIYVEFKKNKPDLDLHKGDVVVVEGPAQVGRRIFAQRGSPPYYVTVQGVTWPIRGMVFSAFKNGDPYAIYYAPHSKTILSAEWLREG